MAAGGDGGGGPGPADMVPTEDTVQTLIEYLVAPLLPVRGYFQEPPSIDQQQGVAKQMHAVVLLYNYFHRKQFRQLEFLDFESFCKVACIAKQSLLMYMKFMHKTEAVELDKQLSITEKMVMDACNICVALDASKDAPNMEEWPVFKVAVFLVDPMKEKCLLQFSLMTQGVWSLVEKELDTATENLVASGPTKNHTLKNKRTGNGSSNGPHENEKLRQLAFSAVEQKTGIDSSNLCILESHLAFSLTKEKTVTQLYIMKYTKPTSGGFEEVKIEYVMGSLKGPLVRSGATTEVTEVVEYFHLLPYIDILSDWLRRETPCDSSLHPLRRQVDADGKSLLKSSGVLCQYDHKITNQCDLNMLSDKMNKIINKSTNDNVNNPSVKSMSYGSACGPQTNPVNPSMEPDKPPTIDDRVVNDDCHQNRKAMDISNDKKRIKDAGKNNVSISGSCLSGSSVAVCRPQNKVDSLSLDYDLHRPSSKENMGSWENIILDTHSGTKDLIQVSANDATNGPSGKEDTIHSPKTSCITENVDGEFLGTKSTCGVAQDVLATSDLPIIPAQSSSGINDAFHLVMASKKNDLLKASLRALQKRRDDLCEQQRLVEDEIARCEMSIQTIISEGEENSMSKVESILEACNALCSSQMPLEASSCSGEKSPPKKIKRKRLSEAVLSLRSSCQDLDDICNENNWMLPRYSVLPSMADGTLDHELAKTLGLATVQYTVVRIFPLWKLTLDTTKTCDACGSLLGMFQASVTLKGLDFELTVGGDLKSSPPEARESAATQMLSKLRSIADQTNL